MRRPTAAELLEVWESGASRTPAGRAALLAASALDRDANGIGELGIGVRDSLLLELRRELLGPDIRSTCRCPHCDELLEFNLNAGQLQTGVAASTGPYEFHAGSWRLRFRLPTVQDTLNMPAGWDGRVALEWLRQVCLLEAWQDGAASPVAAVPESVLEAWDEEISRIDPQGDIVLDLNCPGCGHAWSAPFDAGSFLWAEIGAWAKNALEEVHELAMAYGWSEGEILGLSPTRRGMYLAMVRR